MVAEMQPCNNSFLCLHTHYASLYIHLSLNVNPRASSLWFLSKSLALLASWIVTAIPGTSPEKQWHPEQNCKEYTYSILQPWQPLLPTCQKGSKINYMLGVITPSLAIYVLHQKARTIFHSSPLIMSNSIVHSNTLLVHCILGTGYTSKGNMYEWVYQTMKPTTNRILLPRGIRMFQEICVP